MARRAKEWRFRGKWKTRCICIRVMSINILKYFIHFLLYGLVGSFIDWWMSGWLVVLLFFMSWLIPCHCWSPLLNDLSSDESQVSVDLNLCCSSGSIHFCWPHVYTNPFTSHHISLFCQQFLFTFPSVLLSLQLVSCENIAWNKTNFRGANNIRCHSPTATATVSLVVTDVNDNIPLLVPPVYLLNVSETSLYGPSVVLTQFVVEDKDEGNNSYSTLIITGGNSENKFSISGRWHCISL